MIKHTHYRVCTGKTARLLLSADLPGYVADNRELAFKPGSRAECRSIDPQDELETVDAVRAIAESLAAQR